METVVPIADVIAQEPNAWQLLFGTYAPMVDRIVRSSRSMGSLASSEDARRDVMARVFERLRRDEFRALRLYLAWRDRNSSRTFDDWLTIVTTNVVRDYVAGRLGAEGAKAQLETWTEALPDDSANLLVLPHMTTRETARQLADHARATLPAEQAACLSAWLEGYEFAEIAATCDLPDARAAEKAVRAALARLRRSFG